MSCRMVKNAALAFLVIGASLSYTLLLGYLFSCVAAVSYQPAVSIPCQDHARTFPCSDSLRVVHLFFLGGCKLAQSASSALATCCVGILQVQTK